MASSPGARLRSSTRTERFLPEYSHGTLLYSTSTAPSLVSRPAMPGRAMAANAGLLSTRSVSFVFVLARSVTTTFTPAVAQSSSSLQRTWKHAPQAQPCLVQGGPVGRNRACVCRYMNRTYRRG
uniref:Uncharacterized protein n=1 Tax=Triticum urartu TaxID=4572 RepID=A0A8R7VE41_TRIUA